MIGKLVELREHFAMMDYGAGNQLGKKGHK